MVQRFPRINQTVLAAFLLVSLPGLVVGVVIVLMLGQARMREFYGEQLSYVAQQTAAVVDAYVFRKILDVSVLGRTPELRAAAAAGSRDPVDPAAVRTLDEAWIKGGAVPAQLGGFFESPASRYLADVIVQDQVYRELLLTDRHGRLVAASNRVSDYDQSDEDWWKAAADAQGRVSVTDVRWDESARALALEVAVPVRTPGGDELAGILKAVVDARELLAAVAGLKIGGTGQATLLRSNGAIVFSRASSDPNTRYFATEELSRRLEATETAQTGQIDRFVLRADAAGEAQLIGVAPSQLNRSYPNVNWFVAVSQAERELVAPMRSVGLYLAVLFGAVLITVMGLALYFSMRLAAPPVDVGMDLVEHPPVRRMPDTGEEAEYEPAARTGGRSTHR